MDKELIVTEILDILNRVGGYKLPQDTLIMHLNLKLAKDLPDQECIDALNFALSENWIQSSANSFGKKSWWITESGEVQLNR